MSKDSSPRGALRVAPAAIALLTLAAAPAYAQAPAFTKTLTKVNGLTVTSSPASLNNGDVLDWVMTYQFTPNPAQPAQTDIKDLLPATMQYVPNSLLVPPSWNKQWFNGSTWVTSAPATATGVGAVIGFPHVTPSGVGQTALLPAPPIGSINTGTGGDGYRAIPFNGNVDVINHHSFGTYLDCFAAASGAPCPNYPAHVPLSGTSYVANQDNVTPGKTYEYLDRANGKLYFPVEKFNPTPPHDLGILCADLIHDIPCGFHALSTFNGPSTTGAPDVVSFQGIGGVGGRVYMQVPNGRIACLDTNPATPIPCPGQPYAVVSTTFVNQYADSSEIIGTKIYSTWTMGTATPFTLTCFDATTNVACAGWGIKTPDPAGIKGILYPLLSAAGTVTGICVHTTSPTNTGSSGFSCYDPSNGATVAYPASYLAWVNQFAGGFYQTSGYGQSGYYKARVFNGARVGDPPTIGCYDFAASTPGPCGEPNWPVNNPGVTTQHYATIADPERPGCMWYYGNDGKLGSFLAADGTACGGSTVLDTTITPADSYCAGGAVSGWDKLSVAGLALGAGVTATLTLYDGNNLAVNPGGIPYAQNLAVTSLPLTLGAGGLGIGYGTGPGNYVSLRIVLQFNGVTNHAPWSNTPPPSVEVSWIGGPPQFCFQTKVATCEGPVVTNQATAVTTPAAGAPFNSVAPNPAFSAAHVLGAGCTLGLTINKTVAGAPAGFNGTFKFYVTCSTPNGLLQQQVSLTWPSTTITLSGIPAGSTCTVSEDPALPPLPAGSSWSGVPVSNPASGVVQITQGGKNQISFANAIRDCDDRGHVMITKHVQGAPPGFSGTFNFNVACWSGTTLITQQAQITVPGASSFTVNGIPTGSSCTVTEVPPLPALPPGWFWKPPSYLPPAGQVVLLGNCCPEVVITDEAKFCCTGPAGVPYTPATPP